MDPGAASVRPVSGDLIGSWLQVRRFVAARRRPVVAGLVGLAVVCGLTTLRPAPVASRRVWVAARDLSGGDPLTAADLLAESLPRADLPAGVFAASDRLLGRLLAAPVRRGEPLTDVRLLSPSLLAARGRPGDVAVPVHVADAAATLALVHAGDVVDVIAATGDASGDAPRASTLARGLTVLAAPSTRDPTGEGGGVLIVAAPAGTAATLAAASGARLSVAVERPS